MFAEQFLSFSFLFFFNDTATTEIYTLSLHDALPIYPPLTKSKGSAPAAKSQEQQLSSWLDKKYPKDRKSTRLNSSHQIISYAVFCLKKKKSAFSNGFLMVSMPRRLTGGRAPRPIVTQ